MSKERKQFSIPGLDNAIKEMDLFIEKTNEACRQVERLIVAQEKLQTLKK